MTFLLSLATGILFGSGVFLMLKRDLLRVTAGTIVISNSANLFIMSSGLFRGAAPIYPLPGNVSDPLVQALTLTSIVITFGVSGVLLSLVHRIYTSHQSLDLRTIAQAEVRDENDLEREQERGEELD